MNIFYIHEHPHECARKMTKVHVTKMTLESAQLLCTAHRVLDGTKEVVLNKAGRRQTIYTHPNDKLYKATHVNHPSSIWVRENHSNYIWLLHHFYSLAEEYTKIYGRTHLSYTKLKDVLSTLPLNIPIGNQTPIKLAMPDQYVVPSELQSYKNYYENEKLKTDEDRQRYYSI